MAEHDDFSSEDVWDEYQWERFLQTQDRCTEKYFGLLEKYLDHPDRDNLIASEMGWAHAGQENDWEAEFLKDEDEVTEECAEEEFSKFASSEVYNDTLRLHQWINAWLEADEDLNDDPLVVCFATRSAVCGAKLAAALCGENSTELGMTIAYLKRALKAANDALDAATKLAGRGDLSPAEHAEVRGLIFRIRDRVVDLMGEFRSEWQKRYGAD